MKDSVTEMNAVVKSSDCAKASESLSFSFLFFSDVRKDIAYTEKYQFMRELTLYADQHGFEAVYFPERHFNEFGSMYANPALTAAYLIPQTQRIRFRTAGVTIPLHHPAEIVEWWCMNDVLSGGRIDLGFGSGWHQDDFIFAAGNYEKRKQICSDRIPMIKSLWRGETVTFPGVNNEAVPIRVFPRPIQKELNVWLLVAQNDEAFRYAGEQGYNIFTMLYGVSVEMLAEKIKLYRQALKKAGHQKGTVTLMLHTLVYPDLKAVQNAVEAPFKDYIKSTLHLHYNAMLDAGVENEQLSEADQAFLLEFAYARYFNEGGLFGPVEHVKSMVDRVIAAGVDEIACLVDFGVDYQFVFKSMQYLRQLKDCYHAKQDVITS